MVRRAGLIALAVAAAGCGSSDTPSAKALPDCGPYSHDIDGRFRSLPRGLEYFLLPDELEENVRRQNPDFPSTGKLRGVRSRSGPQAFVLVVAFRRAIPPAGEDAFLRGFAKSMAQGTTYEPADLPDVSATRFEAANRAAYVRIEDHCRVIAVFGDYDRPVRRVAKAVLP